MAHGHLYSTEFGWDVSFEALVARIVADYAARHDPLRVAAWIAGLDGGRVGYVFGVAEDEQTAKLRILLVLPEGRRSWRGRATGGYLSGVRSGGWVPRMRLWTNHPLVAAKGIYLRRWSMLISEEPHHSFDVDLIGQIYERDLP